MSDTTATAALITGIFAISLFCLKYIVNCLCPDKCVGDFVSACNKKPKQINPLIILDTCWEERVIKKNDNDVLDQSKPRGYHNNKDGFYAKRDMENNNWVVSLTRRDIEEKSGVYLYFPFEKKVSRSYKHFFKCKIKYIPDEPNKPPVVSIRIKKFRTEKMWDKDKNGVCKVDELGVSQFKYNNHARPKIHNVITDYPILFDSNLVGTGEYYMNTSIGALTGNTPDAKIDVDREQIGIYFENSGTYIVEEVFYSDEKINIMACPGCFYSFYKFEDQNDKIDKIEDNDNDNV